MMLNLTVLLILCCAFLILFIFSISLFPLFFIQGEEGEQGSPGEVGTQGPTVRYCIFQVDNTLRSFLSLRDSDTCCIHLIFQGPQGIRGAMGMIGSKGEMVNFLSL